MHRLPPQPARVHAARLQQRGHLRLVVVATAAPRQVVLPAEAPNGGHVEHILKAHRIESEENFGLKMERGIGIKCKMPHCACVRTLLQMVMAG